MTNFSKHFIVATAMFTLLTGCDTTQNYEQPLSINAPCLVHKNTFCIAKPHPIKPLIASASYDKTVKIWQQNTGDVVQKLSHPEGVPALAFSPDGKYLVTGSYDNVVRLWDLQSGTLIRSLNGHTQIVWGTSFAPDGKSFASVGADDAIWLWDFDTGKGKKLGEHDGDAWGVTYSPDSKYVLSSGEDDLIKIWQISNGDLVNTLDAHTGAVLNIVFSHDGTKMASGGDDYTIKIWNTQNWEVTSTFSGNFYSVYGLAFSPNDKLLVSGGRDKGLLGEFLQYHFDYKSDENSVTMQMWDLEQKTLVKQFNGHSDNVNNIEFSRDGQFIISSGADGKVIIWDAKTN
mgnify:CR=1 FL=1